MRGEIGSMVNVCLIPELSHMNSRTRSASSLLFGRLAQASYFLSRLRISVTCLRRNRYDRVWWMDEVALIQVVCPSTSRRSGSWMNSSSSP